MSLGRAGSHPAFMPEGDGVLTVRDYLAAHANEEDIADMMAQIQKVEKVVAEGGRKSVTFGVPDNARQIARYMHADAMLKVRAP